MDISADSLGNSHPGLVSNNLLANPLIETLLPGISDNPIALSHSVGNGGQRFDYSALWDTAKRLRSERQRLEQLESGNNEDDLRNNSANFSNDQNFYPSVNSSFSNEGEFDNSQSQAVIDSRTDVDGITGLAADQSLIAPSPIVNGEPERFSHIEVQSATTASNTVQQQQVSEREVLEGLEFGTGFTVDLPDYPTDAVLGRLAQINGTNLDTTTQPNLIPPIFELEGIGVENAKMTLILDQDFLVDPNNPDNQIFYLESSDPILGKRSATIDTEPGTMNIVRFFEGNDNRADRLLFIGEADGLTVHGNFFLGTLNWGYVTVTGSPSVSYSTSERYGGGDTVVGCTTSHESTRKTEDNESSGIYAQNGEFFLSEHGLLIPGRGELDYKFDFHYRNRIDADSPMGYNWDHEYFQNLEVQIDGSVIYDNGLERNRDRYLLNETGDSYISPPEFFTELTQQNDGSFTLREEDGTIKNFDDEGKLREIRDANDNFMSFLYNSEDQLVQVIDTMGRAIDYIYIDSGINEGRLDKIEDFFGRVVDFTYNNNGDLVEFTSPRVTGTPNGNDFLDGKTTRYTYSSGFSNEALNHNLLTITRPNEVANGGDARLINEYGTSRFEFDKVISQTVGGTNVSGVEAGGTYQYEYEELSQGLTGDPNQAISRFRQVDRNGNMTELEYNPLGYAVSKREFTKGLREGEPEFFETLWEYNADGRLLREIMDEGNSIEYVYDENNDSRFAQGNILASTRLPDDNRDSDQAEIKTVNIFEPIYQQVSLSIDPRGLDSSFTPPIPDPTGRTQLERYSTRRFFDYQEADAVIVLPLLAEELGVSEAEVAQMLSESGIELGLGDINLDGEISTSIAGNVIVIAEPSVVLLPDSNQAIIEGDQLQDIVTLRRFNQFGQMTSMVDSEGNVHTYEYFSEQDPDGDGIYTAPPADGRILDPDDGGYLKQQILDAEHFEGANNGKPNVEPTAISTSFRFDPVGNIIEAIDGRGILTKFAVNQLNQVVQITRAAEVPDVGDGDPAEPLALEAFSYIENIFFDFNDNVVKRQIEDRGNTSNTDGFVDFEFTFDILDNVVEQSQEVDVDTKLVTQFRYDANENQTLIVLPEGNAISAFFDERDLLFVSTRGALTATDETLSPPPGLHNDPEEPYNVRGGIPCQCTTFNYDGNRNVISIVDSDDTDLSPDNNGKIANTDAEGDITLFEFDGFDRQVAVIDAVGNETRFTYDPASNVVEEQRFGPIGGPSPTDNLGTDNVLLSRMAYLFDELNRKFQEDYFLFVSDGISTVRPVEIKDSTLTPDDDKVTMRYEYDRKSRRTFYIEDDENQLTPENEGTFRTDYDGADRQIMTLDPEGNTVEFAYDDNNNLIETRETDVAQIAGVADEIFLTTYFYDSLNRVQRTVDNIGQAMFYRYDSRNNLVAMADAQGPLTGETIERRAFSGGALTINDINDFGNVTRYFYDGINRQVREERILTASGEGDGVNIGATLEGVKTTTPTPDPDQGGGDGIIRTGYVYDDNSLLSALVDDQGNITLYLYDNLNRQVTETKGLVRTSPFTKEFILGDRQIITPTAATINDPAFIEDEKIQKQLDKAKERIDAISAFFPPLADDVEDPPPTPQATTVVYGYDPDNNILIREDENDSESFSKFDAINRRVAERVFRSGQNDDFTGDPNFAPDPISDPSNPSEPFPAVIGSNKFNFEFDGLSRLTLATDNNDPDETDDDSVVTFIYDSLSRVVQETQQIGNLPIQVISSAWEAENLRVGLTYPNGRKLEFTFDGLDRIQSITDEGAAEAIVDYDYIGVGRVLERRSPINDTRLTYLNDAGDTDIGYDGLRRTVELRHLRDADNSLIVGFQYGYDRMNNRIFQRRLHDLNNSELYEYDSVYRLINFERGELNADGDGITNPSGDVSQGQEWDLDGVSNWDQVTTTDENGADTTDNREHSSFNELISQEGVTLRYDDNGNLVEDAEYTYEYDSRNRLRTATRKADGVVAEYFYDAMRRRIRKEVDNSGDLDGVTDYYYDGQRVIEERDGNNILTQQYVYGNYIDEVLVLDRNLDGDNSAIGIGDQRFHYHQDAQFSVYAVTDENGDILESYLYDPYGEVTVFDANGDIVADNPWGAANSLIDNPYLFTGRRFDEETGLYYFRARYFDTDQGRFISRDPLGYIDGMSLYEYVQSNPEVFGDPLGTSICCVGLGDFASIFLRDVNALKPNTFSSQTLFKITELGNPKFSVCIELEEQMIECEESKECMPLSLQCCDFKNKEGPRVFIQGPQKGEIAIDVLGIIKAQGDAEILALHGKLRENDRCPTHCLPDQVSYRLQMMGKGAIKITVAHPAMQKIPGINKDNASISIKFGAQGNSPAKICNFTCGEDVLETDLRWRPLF